MTTITYSKNSPISWSPKDRIFTAELSDLQINAEFQVKLTVLESSNSKVFTKYKVDKDASGEDIYGYWYESEDKKEKLLLIND